jgi:hypothetical protein
MGASLLCRTAPFSVAKGGVRKLLPRLAYLASPKMMTESLVNLP